MCERQRLRVTWHVCANMCVCVCVCVCFHTFIIVKIMVILSLNLIPFLPPFALLSFTIVILIVISSIAIMKHVVYNNTQPENPARQNGYLAKH